MGPAKEDDELSSSSRRRPQPQSSDPADSTEKREPTSAPTHEIKISGYPVVTPHIGASSKRPSDWSSLSTSTAGRSAGDESSSRPAAPSLNTVFNGPPDVPAQLGGFAVAPFGDGPFSGGPQSELVNHGSTGLADDGKGGFDKNAFDTDAFDTTGISSRAIESTPQISAHNDDPFDKDLDDRLDATSEAKAFARLAASTDLTPPLAIGIFGPWGSGKSFFMRMIYDHVERLSAGSPVTEAPEAGSPEFHTGIVQIRFNAWHYAETNLWASLVDHIFRELDTWTRQKEGAGSSNALLGTLSTARALTYHAAVHLVARRKDQKSAVKELSQAKIKLEAAKESAKPSLKDAFAEALKAPLLQESKEQLVNAAKHAGFGDVLASAGRFRESLNALQDSGRRASLLATRVAVQLGTWKSFLAFLLIVFGVPLLMTPALSWLMSKTPWEDLS